jgi:hypothetical protein
MCPSCCLCCSRSSVTTKPWFGRYVRSLHGLLTAARRLVLRCGWYRSRPLATPPQRSVQRSQHVPRHVPGQHLSVRALVTSRVQASLRCFGLLLTHVSSKSSVSVQLLGFFQHRNRNLRESALKLLIAGLLQGNIAVDPKAAVRALAPLLADTNQRVRVRVGSACHGCKPPCVVSGPARACGVAGADVLVFVCLFVCLCVYARYTAHALTVTDTSRCDRGADGASERHHRGL